MAAPPAAIARLKAGADGGTAGVKAYDDGAAADKASQRAAVANLGGDAKGFSGGINGLGPQLAKSVAAPGAVGLANLAALKTSQEASNTLGGVGTANYMTEANAAVPVIDAEARLSESQREAMLAASTQRSTGTTKAITDTALRNTLLGYAENQRAQRAQAAVTRDTAQLKRNTAAETNATHQAQELGHWTDPIPGETSDQANAALLADLAKNKGVLQNAHQAALANIQQQQYAPGITGEAQQAGVASGLDPNRLAGILGPTVERSWEQANEKLGNYRNPEAVQNAASDPIAAATALGYEPHQYRVAAKATYLDWQGDAHLRNALAKWTTSDPAGIKAAKDNPKDVGKVRDAFLAAQPQFNNPKNVVEDVIANAHAAITHGIDYGTFVNDWTNDPAAQSEPDAVRLGLAMAQQLFTYRQLQTRQSALSPTGG